MTHRLTTSVAIVGGGPAGLTAALLLARSGVDSMVFERRTGAPRLPRAHLLNLRTMEIFDDIGVANRIHELGPQGDQWRRVAWYTGLGGDTPLHRQKIGEVPAWGGGADADRYGAASPQTFCNLPQIHLDRVLWERAAELLGDDVRAGHEIVDIDCNGTRPVITVRDQETSTTYEVESRYLIVADGGRNGADLLGIPMDGPQRMRTISSVYMSTDLSAVADPHALITHFINPSSNGRVGGVLQALGPGRYDAHSPQWAFAMSGPGVAANVDAAPEAEIRHRLGLPADHPIQTHAISHWQYEAVVAQRFRHGPAFLVGNAAHRHPPTGGLGLNCAVQDSANLAWKLAAVLNDEAADALLDSYESERRPIAALYTAHAMENSNRHLPVAAAIGLRAGMPEPEGWEQLRIWRSPTPEGERRRAETDVMVAENALDYSQLNIEVGYFYTSGAVIGDGTAPPARHTSSIHYEPTARPGHHLPHLWLRRAGTRLSTHALVANHGLTLLTSAGAVAAWRAAVAEADRDHALPLRLEVVDDDAWPHLAGVGPEGAVLVRPDRHVAWRSAGLPPQPAAALSAAVGQLADPANHLAYDVGPLLDRVEAAARVVLQR